jgi:hypothetical protein
MSNRRYKIEQVATTRVIADYTIVAIIFKCAHQLLINNPYTFPHAVTINLECDVRINDTVDTTVSDKPNRKYPDVIDVRNRE